MRLPVLAAEHAARAVPRAVTGSVAFGVLFRLQHQIQRDTEAAAILPVAARAGAKFMPAEMQREAHFGDLEAAEFEATDRMPLADRRPAVTARRGAAAGAGLKQMPDEAAPGARVFALDRDPEPAAPARHRAFRTGGRHRL